MAATVASSGHLGMEPKAGGHMPGDAFRDTKDGGVAGFSTVLAAGSPVSCFGTLLVWGCFSAQPYLYLGLDGRQFSCPVPSQVWHQESEPVLALRLASCVALGKSPSPLQATGASFASWRR